MDAMDFIGPLEVLTHAQHNINDASKFDTSILIDSIQFQHMPSDTVVLLPLQHPMLTLPTATKAFEPTFVALEEHTVSKQGASFRASINFKEAYSRLSEFDILIIPGGGTDEVLKALVPWRNTQCLSKEPASVPASTSRKPIPVSPNSTS